MITEDYISFELAKLLNEKGFDEPVLKFYDHKREVAELYYRPQNKSLTGDTYKCPTLQMAMKWLRDRYKLCIVIRPYVTEEGICYLFEIKEMNKDSVINKEIKIRFDTYEEACEEAIKYCLKKLI